jgi:regulatory protein
LAKKLNLEELLAYAGRLLSGRSLSISELRIKLRQRADKPADVAPVMDRLKSAGYLDDRRFADAFASARRESRGFGKNRVLRDLMARRVAPGLAKEAAERAFSGADEVAMIEDYLARKFRNRNLGEWLAIRKNMASAYRRLRAAGFGVGNSISVLKRYSEEAERLEEAEES